METVALIAPYVAIGAGVAQAGLGVVQGIQSSRAAKLEVQQYEEESRIAMLAADQEEIARRRKLESILAMNETLRGARGLAFDTGSARALRDASTTEAEDDIATARLNRLGQASRAEYGAAGARMRASSGLFSGAGAIASGLGNAASSAIRYIPRK